MPKEFVPDGVVDVLLEIEELASAGSQDSIDDESRGRIEDLSETMEELITEMLNRIRSQDELRDSSDF